MKVFLSYGHNDHAALVNAVFDELTEAGHLPWKDDRYEGESGIPAGADFSDLIYKTILECDFFVAFLTAETVGRPYCKDERTFAAAKKGNHFIQLVLDGVEVTLGNSRSYIDLSDVETPDGGINRDILRVKMTSLLAAMRDPAAFAAGGLQSWAKFETHLRVRGSVPYGKFLTMPEEADFVGREWLREMVIRWAQDNTVPCRMFVLLGEAGTGKTAFVRHLACDKELVRSVHVCRYDRSSTRSVQDTLRDLSYVLAQNNDRYYRKLENKPLEEIKTMQPDALFEFLFLDPMKDETEKYLLIIDGLDELYEDSGFQPLLRLFREYACEVNRNVSFLLTGRPDAELLRLLGTVGSAAQGNRAYLTGPENEEDLKTYIARKLETLGVDDPALSKKLFDACDGCFEYLALLFREAEHEGLALTAQTPMPRGLFARYTQYLDRRMETADQKKLTKPQRLLLAVLAAAQAPMPLSLLADAADVDEDDISDELQVFGSLVRRQDRHVTLFSKRLRDYLICPPDYAEAYRVRAERGDRALALYTMRYCRTEQTLRKTPYLDRWGMLHLLRFAAANEDTHTEGITYLNELQTTSGDGFFRRLAAALAACEEPVLRVYCEMESEIDDAGSIITQLKATRDLITLQALADAYDAAGMQDDALILLGDLLRMTPSPQTIAQAESKYRRALELREQKYNADPNPKNTHALCAVCERLGYIASAKHTPEGDAEAAVWHRKVLPLAERNAIENPGYQSRRDLSFNYIDLGDLARQKHTPEGDAEAAEWYLKALPLRKQNADENPCYQSRRDLSVIYGKLGDLTAAKHTPEGDAEAAEWYLKALPLDEQNADENPGYQSRRGLSVIYERLGDMARAKHTPEGDAEAMDWYLKMLPLREQNADENPGYESRISLSIIYERLGDMARAKHTPKSDAEAMDWYLKELSLFQQNLAEHPGYESRRRLSITYGKLGELARQKHTPEGDAEAMDWYLKALPLREQNAAENPGYESRSDLSVTYNSLGDLARAKHTPEGDAEAMDWYLKMLPLDEQNADENPGYESRRDLSVTYNRLGDLARAKHTPEGDAEAMDWYLKALPLREQNADENPGYESRRDLSIIYERLGNMARAKHTPEGDTEAMDWYLKALPLREQNADENPGEESKSDLRITRNLIAELKKRLTLQNDPGMKALCLSQE